MSGFDPAQPHRAGVTTSFRSRPVLPGTVAVGEVSLSGELRRVSRVDARVREAAQVGFVRAGVPRAQAGEAEGQGVEVVPLATLREAIDQLLGERVELPASAAERAAREAAAGAGAKSAVGPRSGDPASFSSRPRRPGTEPE